MYVFSSDLHWSQEWSRRVPKSLKSWKRLIPSPVFVRVYFQCRYCEHCNELQHTLQLHLHGNLIHSVVVHCTSGVCGTCKTPIHSIRLTSGNPVASNLDNLAFLSIRYALGISGVAVRWHAAGGEGYQSSIVFTHVKYSEPLEPVSNHTTYTINHTT